MRRQRRTKIAAHSRINHIPNSIAILQAFITMDGKSLDQRDSGA
jgi:hypothetical protein